MTIEQLAQLITPEGLASGISANLVTSAIRYSVQKGWRGGSMIIDSLREQFKYTSAGERLESWLADPENPDLQSEVEEDINAALKQAADFQNRLITALQQLSPDLEIVIRERTPEVQLHFTNLPPRNPNFTGRDELLESVEEHLTKEQTAALTALKGLGGIGKTQVALEYAHRHAKDYDMIWWVKSETEASRNADFATLASQLKLPEALAQDANAMREAVKAWLQNPEPAGTKWLMIFDNATNPGELRDYLPGGGHVLITSRYSAWKGVAEPLEVKKMEPDEARDFLLARTEKEDTVAADAIAEELDYLPLALEQAGAYIERTGKPLDEYLEMYSEKRTENFAKGFAKPGQDYPETVLTTWTLSFEAAEKQCAAAGDLLNLCAYFAPDDIPLDVIAAGVEHLPETLADYAKDGGKLDEAVAALKDYSLVTRADNGLSIHRLVQEVTRDRLTEDERRTWAAAAAEIVNKAMPPGADDVRTWEIYDRLLPHGLAVAGHAEKAEIAPKATDRLLNQCGLYLKGRARYEEAKDCYQRAIIIAESLYGPDHPEVAIDVNNLGGVLKAEGDLAGAKACYERALKIWEKELGENHPQVAIGVNNLGLVLQAEGDLAGAKACYERALKIGEATLGKDHPKVAVRVNNLGGVLQDQGDVAGAKACYERALKIWEKELGENHPQVAIGVNNLGLVLQNLGDLAGAKAHLERALKIGEATLGKDHPNVAIRVNNLGSVLQAEGDLAGAKVCFERALKIDEAVYGPDHPHTKLVQGYLESVGKKT